MDTILLLAGAGFLLLLTEMFLPGGVLGALGGLLLVAAIIVAFVQLGALAGSVVLVSVLVLGFAGSRDFAERWRFFRIRRSGAK